MRQVAQGYSNKQIAARLRISVEDGGDVQVAAMEKLGATSRVEVVRYAAGRGGWAGSSKAGDAPGPTDFRRVIDHTEAAAVHSAGKELKNKELEDFATKTLPVIQGHSDQAKKTQQVAMRHSEVIARSNYCPLPLTQSDTAPGKPGKCRVRTLPVRR